MIQGMNRVATPFLTLLVGGLLATPAATRAGDAESFSRETVLQGPSDVVWKLLTTKQGIQSWLAPQAEVDWRVGGAIRTHHDAQGTLGDAQTTVSRILSLAPGRSFTVRVEQTPEGYPFANMVEGTWYYVALEAAGEGRTRLRCVGHGLGEGMAQIATRPLFQQGADLAFGKLKESLSLQIERAKLQAAKAEAAAAAKAAAAAAKSSRSKPDAAKSGAPKPAPKSAAAKPVPKSTAAKAPSTTGS
jgi:uncharacterized protein YndB with AHSA1/START domain